MGDLDRVNETLDIRTSFSAEEALRRAKTAITDLGRVGLMRPEVTSEGAGGFKVVLKPTSPVGITADRTSFRVRYLGDGDAGRVTAEIEDATVYQSKVLVFIPAGPKTVPGAKLYVNCLDAIRKALA